MGGWVAEGATPLCQSGHGGASCGRNTHVCTTTGGSPTLCEAEASMHRTPLVSALLISNPLPSPFRCR